MGIGSVARPEDCHDAQAGAGNRKSVSRGGALCRVPEPAVRARSTGCGMVLEMRTPPGILRSPIWLVTMVLVSVLAYAGSQAKNSLQILPKKFRVVSIKAIGSQR